MKALGWGCKNEILLGCKIKKGEIAVGLKFGKCLGPLCTDFYMYPL